MIKIVIYKGYGAFDLPHRFIMEYAKAKRLHINTYEFDFDKEEYYKVNIDPNIDILDRNESVEYIRSAEEVLNYTTGNFHRFIPQFFIDRTDLDLIKILESNKELTEKSNLKIVEVPDDVDWYIEESDCGYEWVAERHRIWD